MGKPTFYDWISEAGTFTRFRSETSRFRASSHEMKVFAPEFIGCKGEHGELKHLSTRRKGHQPRLR